MALKKSAKRTLVEEMESDTDEFEIHEFKLTRYKEPKVRYTSFDMAIRQAGLFGRYQIFCCVVVQWATIMWAGFGCFQVLGYLEPDWFCPDNNHTYSDLTGDKEDCPSAMNCSKLTATNVQFRSVTIDFMLICDRAYIKSILISMFLIGRLVGSIIGGHTGDYLGRKKSFFCAQFLFSMSGVLTVGSNNWQTLMAFQTMNGFFFGVIEVTCFTLMIEYTDSKYRLIPNACFQWVLGYIIVALVSWLNQDWQMYLIFINLFSAPLLIGFLLFLESPRWLVVKGKLVEAAEVLNDLAGDRWNNTRVRFTGDQLSKIPRDKRGQCYTIFSLFSTKHFAVLSLLQMLATLAYSLVSALFMVNIDAIGINIYTHFLLQGLLRIWVPIIAIVMDFKNPRFGRKHLFLTCCAAVALCFGIIVVALICGVSTDSPFIYIIALLGVTINVSGLYMAILQITFVSYPTVMRCLAFGTLTLTDDIGTILSEIYLTKLLFIWQPWPYIIAEFAILFTYLLSLWLQPETKFRPLPDILEQIED